MIEPVSILAAALSGAFVVVAGAGYALFFAFSRLLNRPRLMPLAYGCYAVLAACVGVLADALSLDGYWWLVVMVMLIGYLWAPHAIWNLSVATHADAPHHLNEEKQS